MPALQITANDGNTGKPIKGAFIHGKVTTPGLVFGVGAEDFDVSERTDEHGAAGVHLDNLDSYNFSLAADANGCRVSPS